MTMIPPDDIASLRKEYKRGDLIESTIPENPMQLFSEWFIQAGAMGAIEQNAMILSTVSQDGKPSSRTVLLKGIEAEDFVFFTNYESRKADEIKQNPYVSLLFLWLEPERQVRIEGIPGKVNWVHGHPNKAQSLPIVKNLKLATKEWKNDLKIKRIFQCLIFGVDMRLRHHPLNFGREELVACMTASSIKRMAILGLNTD